MVHKIVRGTSIHVDREDAFDIGYRHGGYQMPHNNPHKAGTKRHNWYNDGYEQGKSDFESSKNESIDLIKAIASNDTIASSQAFNSGLMSKISDLINSRRQEVAQTMFGENTSFKGKSPHYNTFVTHAAEIAQNIKSRHNVDDKSLHHNVRKVMLNMALPKDNQNYKNTEHLMPSKFDKKLYDNDGANSYDSEWMKHTDDKMNTVVKNGIKNANISESINESKVPDGYHEEHHCPYCGDDHFDHEGAYCSKCKENHVQTVHVNDKNPDDMKDPHTGNQVHESTNITGVTEGKGYLVAYNNDEAKNHFIDHILDHSGLSDNNPKLRTLHRGLSSVDMKKQDDVIDAAVKAGIDKNSAKKAHAAISFQ